MPTPTAPLGTLVLLGGGDDDPMLARLATMLPSSEAAIEVLTTASRYQPARTAAAYAHAWLQTGCANVRHLKVDEKHPADAPGTLARLRAADLVFISGGDQERLLEFLAGTGFLAILKQKYQAEATFILAGTSAGAAALAEVMLVEGHGWRSLLGGCVEAQSGLGLLPGVILDQHFAERARYPRLMHAVLAQPHLLGLGLSEETGLIIRHGHQAEVFGDEVVFTVDASDHTHSNLAALPRNAPISGHGLLVHLLVAGQGLNLATREVNAEF